MMFQFEINRLLSSDIPSAKEIGYLLFTRDNLDGGLNTKELERLIDLLDELIESSYSEGLKDGYEKGYEDGLNAANKNDKEGGRNWKKIDLKMLESR